MNKLIKTGTPKITQTYSQHRGWSKGVDIIKAPCHTDIITAHSAGTVIKVMTGQVNGSIDSDGMGYGNYVMISHKEGYVTLYAHLKDVYVRSGQHVEEGQEIGYMGNTGNSFGAHLHFELRKYNTDPHSLASSKLHNTSMYIWLDPSPYINSALPKANISPSTNTATSGDYSNNTLPNRFKVKINNVQKGAFTYYDKACKFADSIGGIVIDGNSLKQIYP